MEDVTYQERLQAIAERRHQQEEEERLKRETDEEKWKLAQKQRKSLRDQWFCDPPLGDALTVQSSSQGTPEEEEQEVCIRGLNDLASVVSLGAECVSGSGEGDLTTDHMAQRIFHPGQDGRSVLGMVAVQVERDPKTGATVVRSVAPVSSPAAAAMVTTVFDDGRKSVHAIGGGGGAQPSAEELGRILSAVDGVGMTALLDDVAVTTAGWKTSTAEADGERPGESRAPAESVDAPPRVTEVSGEPAETGSRSGGRAAAAAAAVGGGVAVTRGLLEPGVAVREAVGPPDATEAAAAAAADYETPVTLTFLGYADTGADRRAGKEGVALGRDDRGGVLTVERVVIDNDEDEEEDEEEEEILETSAPEPDQRTDNGAPAGPVPEPDAAFQEIQLDGSAAPPQVPGEEAEEGPCDLPPPPGGRGKRADGSSKPKACQCCSVM